MGKFIMCALCLAVGVFLVFSELFLCFQFSPYYHLVLFIKFLYLTDWL